MRQLLRVATTLVFGLLLTAGMAFGQNSADLDQSGGSTTDISQTANNGSNTIEGLGGGSSGLGGNALTQVNGSDATISQLVNGGGAAHTVGAEQLDGGMHVIQVSQNGKSGQFASVNQRSGSENKAFLKQRTASQGVSGNRANIVQEGDDHLFGPNNPNLNTSTTVSFTNSGAGNAQQFGSGSRLKLRQFSGSNDLVSQQLGGDYNTIRMIQRGSAYSEILQDGSQNRVVGSVGQFPGPFKSENADLFVQQTGSGNLVGGEQTASSRDQAYIKQDGITNTTSLVQQ